MAKIGVKESANFNQERQVLAKNGKLKMTKNVT